MERQSAILAATLKKLRTDAKLTQDELALRCGEVPDKITREYISAIEQERVDRPSMERLERISAVLNAPAHILLRAAGYRVNESPPIRRRTLSEALEEAARIAKEYEERNDDEAKQQLQSAYKFFSFAHA